MKYQEVLGMLKQESLKKEAAVKTLASMIGILKRAAQQSNQDYLRGKVQLGTRAVKTNKNKADYYGSVANKADKAAKDSLTPSGFPTNDSINAQQTGDYARKQQRQAARAAQIARNRARRRQLAESQKARKIREANSGIKGILRNLY